MQTAQTAARASVRGTFIADEPVIAFRRTGPKGHLPAGAWRPRIRSRRPAGPVSLMDRRPAALEQVPEAPSVGVERRAADGTRGGLFQMGKAPRIDRTGHHGEALPCADHVRTSSKGLCAALMALHRATGKGRPTLAGLDATGRQDAPAPCCRIQEPSLYGYRRKLTSSPARRPARG